MANLLQSTWSVKKSEETYGVSQWGKGYFSINELGNVCVHPGKDPARGIDLKILVDNLRERGIDPPMLLRFPDVLEHRLQEMNQAFGQAIKDCQYKGQYRLVYPIKVNQQRHMVEEILRFGKTLGFGVEVGSKPELLAVLAMVDQDDTPIVCNGFKDAEYLEAVVLAQKIGKRIIPVIENYNEITTLVTVGRQHNVRPAMGVRLKLASRGTGRWESSCGAGAKFGLNVGELLRALDYLKQEGLVDQLKLLHFHIGSQVTNIAAIKEAVNEAARFYVELHKAGAGMEYLDVGGGLGIDYDGSQTNFESSINYTLEEYAADVVFGIQSVCDQANVPHPIIVSESGRAVAAYYSVLVFNVLGLSDVGDSAVPDVPPSGLPRPVAQLADTLKDITTKNYLEMYHDAVKCREDALTLFNLGYLNLRERDLAETLFWNVCRAAQRIVRKLDFVPEELEALEPLLADTYFCNFSVFQSMPDSWAIDQLFPIMPIHRLADRPDRRATLADITCDSDGKVDRFIDRRDVKKVLELHSLNGTDYYLAAFLMGAYQEILGDLHNLFGDTHAVHVTMDESGVPVIDNVVKGDTVREVLHYVQYSADELLTQLRREVEKAVRREKISVTEAGKLLQFYENGLNGYTYLE